LWVLSTSQPAAPRSLCYAVRVTDADATRRARAEARRGSITVRRVERGADEAPTERIRGEAALSLVTKLTRAAWVVTGRPFPSYRRDEIPCVFVPHAEARA